MTPTSKDLKIWLADKDIITIAVYPENFICMILSPSECGKTFLLKELITGNIYIYIYIYIYIFIYLQAIYHWTYW